MAVNKRNIALFVLLNILTFGIYGVVTLCKMGDELESICQGDERRQMKFVFAWLLGFVTLGIVPLFWLYTAMERLRDNAYRYGNAVNPKYSGIAFLLWHFLGIFILVGPMVALCLYVSDMNAYADAQSGAQPLPYAFTDEERGHLVNMRYRPQGMPVNKPADMPATKPVNSPVKEPVAYANADNNEKKTSVDSVPPTRPVKGAYHGNRSGSITCVSGMYEGFSFPIADSEKVIIGTDPGQCNIIIDENADAVDAKHCTVTYEVAQDNYIVVDHSINGIYTVDDRRLSGGSPESLKVGDVIKLGDGNNTFRFG